MNVDEVYTLGHVKFMGLDLLVATGALVPREETELLGRTALRVLSDPSIQAPRIIDVCCGSGNLACAIASNLPNARVWATDLTTECVSLTRRNVEHLNLTDQISVYQGDLFSGLGPEVQAGSVDAIVCNPPYISERRLATDRAELLAHEPREAFDAGPYGLRIHQRVVKEALPYLRTGGTLMFEFGVGQEKQVAMLFSRTKVYSDVELVPDAANVPRVAMARKLPGIQQSEE